MMNKKLIAILMTAITVSMVSARFCRDENGNRVSCTGRVIEGTADTAANILTFGGHSRRKNQRKAQYEQQVVEESIGEEPQYEQQVVEEQ
jgi:hypothetical protein